MNIVLQLLSEKGHEGFAEGFRLLIDEAMRHERASALLANAGPTDDPRPATGFAKRLQPQNSRHQLGPSRSNSLEVRGGVDFYPAFLEGFAQRAGFQASLGRDGRADVSTPKVCFIVEQLCGFFLSSTQISQYAAKSKPY